MSEPFNPLDMNNLAQSIVNALLATEPTPLDTVGKFLGAGLYAIYYFGDSPTYSTLSALNQGDKVEHPIYVGKAIPSGGRRGFESKTTTTTALSSRIRQHAASIRAAENLDIDHFSARWLVVDDIWIPLGESALIRRYRPIWNAVLDGFGNHDPGKGRHAGERSRWDTIHPGRGWSVHLAHRKETASQIEQDIEEYLRSRS